MKLSFLYKLIVLTPVLLVTIPKIAHSAEPDKLGGWSNYEMVLRYAHLSSEHLRVAAERV